VLVTLVAGGLSLALSARQSPRYQAVAQVLLNAEKDTARS